MTPTERKARERMYRTAMRLYRHWVRLGEWCELGHWYPLGSEKQAKAFGRACADLAKTSLKRKRKK